MNFRKNGPLGLIGCKPKQTLVITTEKFTGVSSNKRAMAEKFTENTGLAVDERDITVGISSKGDSVITVDLKGPDVIRSDIEGIYNLVTDVTGSQVKSVIVRART